MPVFASNRINPNPISKLIVTLILGTTILHPIHYSFEWVIVGVISMLTYINGYKKNAIGWFIIFAVLSTLPNFMVLSGINPILKVLLSLPIIIRIFILPFLAANFMIKTSDVGAIISSMDALKLTRNISIPIAVMFRFFPSYKEEKKNIKMAMKIRDAVMAVVAANLNVQLQMSSVLSSKINSLIGCLNIAKFSEVFSL